MGRCGLRHNQDVPQFIHAANGQTCVAESERWLFIDPASYWSIAVLVSAARPDGRRDANRIDIAGD